MIKNILAAVGVLAILLGVGTLVVLRPWESKADVVSDENSAMVVRVNELRFDGVDCHRVSVTIERGKPKAQLYLSYSKFYSGTVLLKAFDRAGTEIGRAKRAISGNTEDAGYVDFDFDARVPLKSAMFFSLTKSQAEPEAPAVVPEPVDEQKTEENSTEPATVPAAPVEPAAPAEPVAPAEVLVPAEK